MYNCHNTKDVLHMPKKIIVTDLDQWLKERDDALRALTPEARKTKRTRGRKRTEEEKRALALACKKAWDDWLSSGELIKIAERKYILL